MTGRAGPARATPDMVAQLAAEGHGRNSCARELGLSRRQVDRLAREAGIKWERAATEAATRARMADVRASLTADFADIADGAAERLLDALDRDEIDPHVLRALAQVAGLSVDKLTALADRIDADDAHPDSLLDQLRAGIDNWHQGLTEQNTDDDNQIITSNSQEDQHDA